MRHAKARHVDALFAIEQQVEIQQPRAPSQCGVVRAHAAVCGLDAQQRIQQIWKAYLATSPGALETVLALSAEGGAGPAVIAVQLTRLIAVLVVAGYLPQLLRLAQRLLRR